MRARVHGHSFTAVFLASKSSVIPRSVNVWSMEDKEGNSISPLVTCLANLSAQLLLSQQGLGACQWPPGKQPKLDEYHWLGNPNYGQQGPTCTMFFCIQPEEKQLLQVATLPVEQQYSVSSSNPSQFLITYSYQKRLFELSGVYMNVDAGTHYQPNSSLNGLARVELYCWLAQPYAMNHCNFAEKMALRHLNEQRQKKIIEPLKAAKRIVEKDRDELRQQLVKQKQLAGERGTFAQRNKAGQSGTDDSEGKKKSVKRDSDTSGSSPPSKDSTSSGEADASHSHLQVNELRRANQRLRCELEVARAQLESLQLQASKASRMRQVLSQLLETEPDNSCN